jgi:hypothetical protein
VPFPRALIWVNLRSELVVSQKQLALVLLDIVEGAKLIPLV